MREIKFRAFNELEKLMGAVIKIDYRNKYITAKTIDGYFWDDTLIESKLMQYTGLKDKNGNEIYEGDICNIKVWFGEIFTICPLVIIFKDQKFGYELYEGSGDYYVMCLSEFEEYEIIGNIHENPELLEKK